MHPQASFRFSVSERCQFDNFVAGDNTELLSHLQARSAGSGFEGSWVFAAAGLGKSHLLQASCAHAVEQDGERAVYLPLTRVRDPAALMGLETLSLVALDDLDERLGDEDFERALMALYTGLFEAGGRLLIATEQPPAAIAPLLPDLASRFRSFASFDLQPLDDNGKANLLRLRAEQRGLPLSAEVLRFWLRRAPRDLRRLLEDLDLLIDHALGEQSALTIHTVKQVLQL